MSPLPPGDPAAVEEDEQQKYPVKRRKKKVKKDKKDIRGEGAMKGLRKIP